MSPSFGGMIAFVKESEALIEKGQQDRLRSEEGGRHHDGVCNRVSDSAPDPFASSLVARVALLVRGFSSTWKQAVEGLSQDVMRSFTNFKNGTSIIQVTRRADGAVRRRTPDGIAAGFSQTSPHQICVNLLLRIFSAF